MTQRVFDIENEKDYADLWDILPDNIERIEKDLTDEGNPYNRYYTKDYCYGGFPFININWHDKTEITRPLQEATGADIGKLCYFWDDDEDYSFQVGLLTTIRTEKYTYKYVLAKSVSFGHCRRLTKQEIEELC